MLPASRLGELYGLFVASAGRAPDAPPAQAPWSTCMAELERAARAYPAWTALRIGCLQRQAAFLKREGQTGLAIEVLEGVVDAFPEDPNGLVLRLDLGSILRSERLFGRAWDELKRARDALAAIRLAPDLAPSTLKNLSWIEPTIHSELGVAAAEMGLLDTAHEEFAWAEDQARRLGDELGPAVWGANLVYRLNLPLIRYRGAEVARWRADFEANPWRMLLPRDTRQQIELRLAVARTVAAQRGEEPAGAGEDELRRVLAEGLKTDESVRAWGQLAESLIDRGALAAARDALDQGDAQFEALDQFDPGRLHLAGARGDLLVREGASVDRLRQHLVTELRPNFERMLAKALTNPIEESGLSLTNELWIRGALQSLCQIEGLVNEDGRGPERALEWVVRLQGAATFARSVGVATPDLDRVRRDLVAADRALIVYVPGRAVSHAFVVGPATVSMYALGPGAALGLRASELEEATTALATASDADSARRFERAVERSSQAFLPAPLASELSAYRALEVVGLDDFGYLPFELLHGAAPDPIGAHAQVTYQPSVPVGVWLAERDAAPRAPTAPVLFVLGRGDPGAGGWPGLRPLTTSAEALGAVALTRAHIDCAVLDAPGPEQVREGLANAAAACFFLHGVHDVARVRPAGVLLDPRSPQGAWFASDIERCAAPALVIVAACGSDAAPWRSGDDGQGHLRSAFFRAGSRCVAAPVLALEEASTARVLERVAADLAGGGNVARAFLEARRSTLGQPSSGPSIAPFLIHVYGDARGPVFAALSKTLPAGARTRAGRQTAVAWALLAAAFAAGALWALRRRRSREGA